MDGWKSAFKENAQKVNYDEIKLKKEFGLDCEGLLK